MSAINTNQLYTLLNQFSVQLNSHLQNSIVNSGIQNSILGYGSGQTRYLMGNGIVYFRLNARKFENLESMFVNSIRVTHFQQNGNNMQGQFQMYGGFKQNLKFNTIANFKIKTLIKTVQADNLFKSVFHNSGFSASGDFTLSANSDGIVLENFDVHQVLIRPTSTDVSPDINMTTIRAAMDASERIIQYDMTPKIMGQLGHELPPIIDKVTSQILPFHS